MCVTKMPQHSSAVRVKFSECMPWQASDSLACDLAFCLSVPIRLHEPPRVSSMLPLISPFTLPGLWSRLFCPAAPVEGFFNNIIGCAL